MTAETDHSKTLDRLADTHAARLSAALVTLEERIASLMVDLPSSDGALFDLAAAVQIRQGIQEAFNDTYLTEADSIVRDYDRALESVSEMLSEYGDFVSPSASTVNALKQISFAGFEDVGLTFVDELANEIYQNTLTGRPVADSIKAMRGKINGVYQQADQDEIAALVEVAQAGGAAAKEAIERLHTVYAADKLGRNLRRYANQQVHDSLMQFDASINVNIGFESGATKWKYYGTSITDTREFCREIQNKEFTEEEIRTIWNERDWAGKASGDPFIVRGGYNCRHHWRPVFDNS
jgi:hypothetical protein